MIHLYIFGSAFVIVALTAANVRLVSQGRYLAAFCTGGALSWVWWHNTNLAVHAALLGGGEAYALGAAVGTVLGAWVTRPRR